VICHRRFLDDRERTGHKQAAQITIALFAEASEPVTGKVGYVLKDQVHPWPTREALNFSMVAFNGERSEIVAWDDEDVLSKFLETGNQKVT
jgi:hypothetical protein